MRTLTFGYAAFLVGLLVELWFVSRDFRLIGKVVLFAFGGSLGAFLPSSKERSYVFQEHLDLWPIVWAISAVGAATFLLGKRLLAPLNEGSSLILAMAYYYWLVEKGWGPDLSARSAFLFLPVVPVFVSALTTWHLSRGWRAYFGVLNSLLLLVFGAEFFIRVLGMRKVEDLVIASRWDFALEVVFQHFFLGTVCIYLVYHLFLVMVFWPGKRTFFNQRYFQLVNETLQQEAERFSPEQIPIPLAAACIIFVGGLFFFNYQEQAVPASLAIAGVLTLGAPLFWLAHRVLLRIF